MIIGIDMGHTLNPANYGAIGIKNESEETRAVGKRLIRYLECMGNTVVNVTQDYSSSKTESLKQRVEIANQQPLDLFVSLHFNSFDGERNGSEVYTYGGKRLPAAVRVLDNLSKLGFKNKGIFDGSKLYVVRKSKAPAMLIEIAYIDSDSDMKMYNPNLIARVIAEGITGSKIPQSCLGVNDNFNDEWNRTRSNCSDINTKSLYKVTVGGYLSYNDARDTVLSLKSMGYLTSMETID